MNMNIKRQIKRKAKKSNTPLGFSSIPGLPMNCWQTAFIMDLIRRHAELGTMPDDEVVGSFRHMGRWTTQVVVDMGNECGIESVIM